MEHVGPIYTVELFPPLSRELITLLNSLQPEDWTRSTICAPWTVKDVAAHLLGGNLGRLWNREKKSLVLENPVLNYNELLALINRNNQEWVQAARRISPHIMIELLELTDRHLYEHFKSLNPDELASTGVAWADDTLPPNWFDIAREYTEKWLHQQHIREAVNQPLLMSRTWLFPVLDTFMRGLPRTFRNNEAVPGTRIVIQVLGDAGGEWTLIRNELAWELLVGYDPQANAYVQLDQDLAWRLFTKGIPRDFARQQAQINGNTILGERVLDLVSIMA